MMWLPSTLRFLGRMGETVCALLCSSALTKFLHPPQCFHSRECASAFLLSSATLRSWRDAAEALTQAGATVFDISIPAIASSLAAYYVIVSAEASSNLARYDGTRQCNEESVKVEQQAFSGFDRAQISTEFRTASFGAEVCLDAYDLSQSSALTIVSGAAAHSCRYICS